MSANTEDDIYDDVLRKVLWDEDREKVFRMLTAHGIVADRAEELYRRARRERIAAIRGEHFKQAAIGSAILLIGGLGLFCLYWYQLGGITRGIFVISAVFTCIGMWKLLEGITGILLAPRKQGCLADVI